jgi:hypothetical protein
VLGLRLGTLKEIVQLLVGHLEDVRLLFAPLFCGLFGRLGELLALLVFLDVLFREQFAMVALLFPAGFRGEDTTRLWTRWCEFEASSRTVKLSLQDPVLVRKRHVFDFPRKLTPVDQWDLPELPQ